MLNVHWLYVNNFSLTPDYTIIIIKFPRWVDGWRERNLAYIQYFDWIGLATMEKNRPIQIII